MPRRTPMRFAQALDEAASWVEERRRGEIRVLAVDGHSAAGKSKFADALASRVNPVAETSTGVLGHDREMRFNRRGQKTPVVERRESLDHARIELPAAQALDLGHRLLHGPGGLVRTFVRERVEHIGNGDDPTADRDLLTAQPSRVAGAVPALMMGERDLFAQLQYLRAAA
jgi:hypothetical protein